MVDEARRPVRRLTSWSRVAGLMAAITLGAGLVGVAEAQTPAVQPAETARNTARDTELAAGEIIVAVTSEPNGNAGLVQATIDIAVPPSRLWALLLDCSLSLKLNERLKSCRVIKADPAGRFDIREHIVEWIWPLPKVRSVFRSDYVAPELIRFQKVEGDLAELSGIWKLDAIRNGRGTRRTYAARIDPGVAVPGFVMRGVMEAEVRRTLTGLRQEATGREK